MKNNNPSIYLLKIISDDKTLYKIGYTTGSVYNRIKNIQTGCPYKIEVADVYISPYSKIIEKTLHNLFSYKNTHGEWFDLGSIDEFNFRKLCQQYEKIQITLDEYRK